MPKLIITLPAGTELADLTVDFMTDEEIAASNEQASDDTEDTGDSNNGTVDPTAGNVAADAIQTQATTPTPPVSAGTSSADIMANGQATANPATPV
jgi:hypothetical protein